MLDRVVSGGQTGADQAGLRAARSANVPTGGWAPLGWLTEDGPAPWLAEWGLVECPDPGYPARTRANARDSDGTVWLGDWHSSGGRATLDACRSEGKPFMIVHQGVTRPSQVAEWLEAEGVRILNVAGNRESVNPGIGARVERFMAEVLRQLAKD